MLCPNCGKDVGDKPRLCDACESAMQPPEPDPVVEDQELEIEAEATEDGPGNLPAVNYKSGAKPTAPKEAAPKARTADSSKKNLPIVIGFGAFLLSATVGFLVFSSGSSGGNSVAPSTPNSSSATPQSTEPAGAASPNPVATSSEVAATTEKSVEVNISSMTWKESIVVYNQGKHEVTFAFFESPLSDAQKSLLKSEGTLPSEGTRFFETFALEPSATEFVSANVRSLKATYSGPETSAQPIGVSYVVGKKELPVASKLSGKLEESALLEGESKQAAEKTLENGRQIKLNWDLQLKAPIGVVVGKVDASASPASSQTPQPSPSGAEVASSPSNDQTAPATSALRDGELGSVTAAGNVLAIKEAFALYYPESGSVSIGLFGQELNDVDRAALLKKRVVSASINGKKASVVLSLDFSKKDGEASKQTLIGYTTYFYRDSSGLFSFPGGFDSKSVKRQASELQGGEFTVLSGQLKNGEILSIRTAGDNKPEEGYTKFEWNLQLKVKLNAVQ